MIEWYLKVVRDNYANFSGRARRSEYWYFVLCNLLITLLLFILMFVSSIFLYLLIIYALATMIPGIAVVVRRLHDIGKSGAYYFVSFIPIVGGIWLLVLLCTEGDSGPNEYGEDPKANYNEFNNIGTSTEA